MKRAQIAAAIAAVVCAVAALIGIGAAPAPAIVGGQPVHQLYPAMGSLQLPDADDSTPGSAHHCGAVVVEDPRYAAVNAHCITEHGVLPAKPFDPHQLTLRIGSPDNDRGGVVIGVKEVLPHAEWAWASGLYPHIADVGMVRLNRPAPVRPIPIAQFVRDQRFARVLGWGLTDPTAEQGPTWLQQLDMNVVSPENCAASFIDAGEICLEASDLSRSPCFGDSGGPALQRGRGYGWVDIGGASRTTTDDCRGGAVYTSLVFYRDWYLQVIRTGTVPKPTDPPNVIPLRARTDLHWTGIDPAPAHAGPVCRPPAVGPAVCPDAFELAA